MHPAEVSSVLASPQVAPAGVAARRRPDVPRSRWVAATIVAAAPVVILVVLRASPYFRQNNGDPFIYAGYANDFQGHVVRFSYTYYAVRWGLIFPMRAALAFGPVWGYLLLRYALYQLAIVPLYFALRPWGRRVAVFGVVVFVANPVTAQAILSTYHDSIAVPVLTAVSSLLVIAARSSRRTSIACCAAAGCLAGVGINANLFVIPLTGVAGLALCGVLLAERRIRNAVDAAIALVAGIVVVSVAGIVAYWVMFDDPNIYETTFRALGEIDGDATWRSPSYGWLTSRWYVYAPAIPLGLAALVLVKHRRPLAERRAFIVAAAIAGGSVAWFLVHQFLMSGYTVEHAYYYSYVIGPATLLLGAAAGELTRARGPLHPAAPAIALVLAWAAQTFELPSFAAFLVVATVAVVVMTRIRPPAAVMLIGLAVMNVAWGAAPRNPPTSDESFQYEPHYETAFGDADDTAFEAYVLANELPTVVPTIGVARPPVRFWYRSGDPMIDSVQSSYLWQVTTVQVGAEPGMPLLTEGDRARISDLVIGPPPDLLPGYLVLLARTPDEIDAGRLSLLDAGFGLAERSRTTLRHGDSILHTLVVRVVSAPE